MKINKIALLGVDGSGKSTMSKILSKHLQNNGYNVKIIPFHKWVFAGFLRNIFGKFIDKNRSGRETVYKPQKKSFSAFIMPPVAFIDNLLFLFINSPRGRNDIYIYDRFVCATQIKFSALGYLNNWFKYFWFSCRPNFAIIFNVNLDESVKRQIERDDPYAYPKDVLKIEQELYFQYAKTHNFPIVESKDISSTKDKLLSIIDKELSKV